MAEGKEGAGLKEGRPVVMCKGKHADRKTETIKVGISHAQRTRLREFPSHVVCSFNTGNSDHFDNSSHSDHFHNFDRAENLKVLTVLPVAGDGHPLLRSYVLQQIWPRDKNRQLPQEA